MTDDLLDTQWTPAARDTYAARVEQLITALREHAELTLARSGRQAEHVAYFPSAIRLHQAAVDFDRAEFEWCGSSPLGVQSFEADDDEDDESDAGDVLTVVGRWDYRIVDEAATIAAGRAAYARTWPSDTDEDAAVAVADAISAAREIAHADNWDALESAPGIEPIASAASVLRHDGDDWFDADADPFAIARD